jgi:hypothetical protein
MTETSYPKPTATFSPHFSVRGREKTVKPGDYELLQGSSDALQIKASRIHIVPEGQPQIQTDPYLGVHSRGLYVGEDPEQNLPVVSFLYHKNGPDGRLETIERLIISTGIGYGAHPGHVGQDPTWYLVGAQIGTFDHGTGQIVSMVEGEASIETKAFSIACIAGGPLGDPILANPAL